MCWNVYLLKGADDVGAGVALEVLVDDFGDHKSGAGRVNLIKILQRRRDVYLVIHSQTALLVRVVPRVPHVDLHVDLAGGAPRLGVAGHPNGFYRSPRLYLALRFEVRSPTASPIGPAAGFIVLIANVSPFARCVE